MCASFEKPVSVLGFRVLGKCFGLPQTETRQFASFLALAGLCRLRRDFLNNSKALASVGRLPGCPDLHHLWFLHRYQIRQIGVREIEFTTCSRNKRRPNQGPGILAGTSTVVPISDVRVSGILHAACLKQPHGKQTASFPCL